MPTIIHAWLPATPATIAAAAISSSTNWVNRSELGPRGAAGALCADERPVREPPVPDGCTVACDHPADASEPRADEPDEVPEDVYCALATGSPCTDCDVRLLVESRGRHHRRS
jgi:hypothetical protein